MIRQKLTSVTKNFSVLEGRRLIPHDNTPFC